MEMYRKVCMHVYLIGQTFKRVKFLWEGLNSGGETGLGRERGISIMNRGAHRFEGLGVQNEGSSFLLV